MRQRESQGRKQEEDPRARGGHKKVRPFSEPSGSWCEEGHTVRPAACGLTGRQQQEKHAALGTTTREESSPWAPTEMTLLNRMNVVLDIFLPVSPAGSITDGGLLYPTGARGPRSAWGL